MSDDLFVTPLPDVLTRAVEIAREAWEGEPGEIAEQAYRAQMDRSLAQTGMSVDELDRLGAPRTWVGRMVERAQDWWWDRRYAGENDANEALDLEAAFSFPIPLLQTKPLQDTPFEYDEVDRLMAEAAAEISNAITAQTGWTPAFSGKTILPKDPCADPFDPGERVLAFWSGPDGTFLALAESFFDEDPKLMGHSLGLLYLTGARAGTLFG